MTLTTVGLVNDLDESIRSCNKCIKLHSIGREKWLQRECAADLALITVVVQPHEELLIALAAQCH